uniref:Lily type lectin 2 n=1 Tax=Channa striata TaxID=64152 RepID=A0A0D6DQH8_CHASR|nr:Lily type lectin 2 [Channa striata]
MSRNCLFRFQEFRKGDYLVSNNGNFKAIFQGDGNFVIYTWKPIWASDTANSDVVRLCMQDDCNLVMYNKDGTPRWQTNSHRPSCTSCSLYLTDEGVLVLTKDREEIWNSNQSRGMK